MKTFLFEHAERFAQAVQKIRRRRVREEAGGVVADHRLPVPVRARQSRARGGVERLFAEGIEPESGRQHQSLLRAGDGHVHLPRVMVVVDRSER